MPETPKRIHLLNSAQGRYEEGKASGVIKPGMLLANTSTVGEVIAHNAAAAFAERNFALENALQGKTIDDNYADDDLVFIINANPGDVVYAWLAAGESVTPADSLTSNGDGTLKKATSTNYRVAVPLETVVNDDTDAVDVRIRVRVL